MKHLTHYISGHTPGARFSKNARLPFGGRLLGSVFFETSKIKLATGTLNLPNSHPANIAGQVSMLDNMLKGRFIMGIGPGSLSSDMEVFDTLNKNRTEI